MKTGLICALTFSCSAGLLLSGDLDDLINLKAAKLAEPKPVQPTVKATPEPTPNRPVETDKRDPISRMTEQRTQKSVQDRNVSPLKIYETTSVSGKLPNDGVGLFVEGSLKATRAVKAPDGRFQVYLVDPKSHRAFVLHGQPAAIARALLDSGIVRATKNYPLRIDRKAKLGVYLVTAVAGALDE